MRSFFQPLTACNMLRGRKMQMSWLLSAQSSHRGIRSQKEKCQEQRVKLETVFSPSIRFQVGVANHPPVSKHSFY